MYTTLTPIHLHTLTNIFPAGGTILYKNFPKMKIIIETIIRIAGTPKASGKQSTIPKQLISSLKIGVTEVEMREPALTAK